MANTIIKITTIITTFKSPFSHHTKGPSKDGIYLTGMSLVSGKQGELQGRGVGSVTA